MHKFFGSLLKEPKELFETPLLSFVLAAFYSLFNSMAYSMQLMSPASFAEMMYGWVCTTNGRNLKLGPQTLRVLTRGRYWRLGLRLAHHQCDCHLAANAKRSLYTYSFHCTDTQSDTQSHCKAGGGGGLKCWLLGT